MYSKRVITRPRQSWDPVRPNRYQSLPGTPSRGARTSSVHRPQTSADSRRLRDELLANQDFRHIKTAQLESVIPALREYVIEKGGKEDYVEAQRAQELSKAVMAEIDRRGNRRGGASSETDVSEQSRNFEQAWKARFTRFDNETKSRRRTLEDSQERERQLFEKKWREEMPNRYRKPSMKLIQLKKVEKTLAATADFERAREAHEDVERQMQMEMEEAQNKLVKDYEAAKRRLEAKQKQLTDAFESQRELDRNLMKTHYLAEKKAVANRRKVVESKRREEARTSYSRSRDMGTLPMYPAGCYRNALSGLVQLPPLVAPNDPDYRAEQDKRKREQQRKQQEYQKKNADSISQQYGYDTGRSKKWKAKSSSSSDSESDSGKEEKRESESGEEERSRAARMDAENRDPVLITAP